MLLAWTIIMVHSIVPHHHHTNEQSHCHTCEEGYKYASVFPAVEFSEHTGEDHFVCHFHVEAFANLTLDIHFLPPATDELVPLKEIVVGGTPVDKPLRVESLYLTNYQLRAPPAVA